MTSAACDAQALPTQPLVPSLAVSQRCKGSRLTYLFRNPGPRALAWFAAAFLHLLYKAMPRAPITERGLQDRRHGERPLQALGRRHCVGASETWGRW